jgi:hypothetical protein
MKKTVLDVGGLVIWVALVVAVCNWLNAPDWVTIGLPVLICGGAAVTWVVRLVRWATRRPTAS